MALEQEMETYRRNLPKLLQTPGKFVLIKGKKILGIYETDEAALDAGVDLLGPRVDFLAKKIEAFEKPVLVRLPASAFENATHKTTARGTRRRR